ncbi:hypothetical protein GCM10011575_47420 [Microlunatus endophyticus]|uniref:Ribbon-helix-helix protein CopG domain-containing protein n=1 Tax=Microlunatus endophyticus TaxID=1716077 RepID=A0A917SI62_9ACTN|nr:ribbon-helix-helix domain-containing protein [Microlunatus endophyticus]GGL83607.1 hypothetical protein GCM10011575_47420 [Microlunatus endophyticus]
MASREALRRAARIAEVSQAEIIYEALETYVAAGGRAPDPEQANGNGLFHRRPVTTGLPRSMHTVRMPAANVDIIDGLVAETGHPNRSALIEAALTHKLDAPEPDREPPLH